MADGAVFAAGVDALQHHQQRALPFGIELVLEDGEPFQILLQVGGRPPPWSNHECPPDRYRPA